MNLDDPTVYQQLDRDGMGDHIDNLPDQIAAAWQHAQTLPRPPVGEVSQVVICGMGGSAIGGSLLQTLVADQCTVPILSIRDYTLPAYVGPKTLVVGASHSGNTEETLSAFQQAHARGARLVSFSTGGQLAELTARLGGTHWTFDYDSQPRAAIGYALMLPLALLCGLELVRDHAEDVAEAVAVLRRQQSAFRRETPVVHNPAKRLAGQLMDRYVLIFAAEPLAPVARRWRGQIAENGNAWAQYEELPEMNHNAVAGVENPERLIQHYMVLFLDSSLAHARNRRRLTLTQELFMTAGYNTDVIRAEGTSRLAQMLSTLHYGDYVSYYLAIAYERDPTSIDAIGWLKEQLAAVA